ncbi:hypothetical protein ACFOQM_18540 [Paenibacillus sp. GCM10012307]|uniref:hypothetical protein n=1 Tax=Paenibacillus sp. GCM10012307 TaxID=3317343 RepID=UPI0036079A48
MMERSGLTKLVLIEKESEFLVSFSVNPDDWIARFDKSLNKARDWALNMVNLYNHELQQENEI